MAASDTHMVTFVCPMARYTAAPALYSAFAGKDMGYYLHIGYAGIHGLRLRFGIHHL